MDNVRAIDPESALAAVRGLLAGDVDSLPLAQLGDDLRTLQVIRNMVDADFLRRLGVFDVRGGAAEGYALSTQSWLQYNCRISGTAAHGRLAIARRLHRESQSSADWQTVLDRPAPLRDALVSGSLPYEHAEIITRALDRLPSAAQAPAEQILVDAAGGTGPSDLKKIADTIREAVAPELLVEETRDAFDRRFLNMSETMEGRVAISGMLDAEGGAAALSAVNALATPTGPDDTRTAAQRRHDALIEVITAGLSLGEMPETGGERPHVTVTMDVGPYLPDGHGIPIGHTPAGGVLAGATMERILCDSSIVRVLTRGPSEVLDIGRKSRIVPPAIRRALAIRDGGCAGHQCDRPPAWTDVHHVIPWSQGGETNLASLVLLCRRHHILVHEGGWVCVHDGTGWTVLPPQLAGDPPPAPDTVSLCDLTVTAAIAQLQRPGTNKWMARTESECQCD